VFYLLGCTISPWKRELYVNKEIPLYSEYDDFPDRIRFQQFILNNSFIKVYLKACNNDNYHSSSPYFVYIRAWGELEIGDILTIDKMSITSSLGRRIDFLDNVDFPLEAEFEKGSERYNRALIEFDKLLDLQFKEGEEITISITVRIKRGNEEQSKIMEYKFTPKTERGLFQIQSV